MPLSGHPLDSCARLHLDRGGRIGSYFGCGLLGVGVGATLVVVLAGTGAVPVASRAALIAVVAPQLAFLFLVKMAQIITGRERIVMYEMALGALLCTALTLAALGEPAGPGIDLAATGIMGFLAVARVGCLLVGCCHGRPHRRGIAYGPAHVAAGFPRYLAGVRLFPIQIVEAVAAAGIAATAAARALGPHVPGEIAALALTLYGLCRFGLEVCRGDAARPSAGGLSEAQWTAVALSWALALLSRRAGFACPPAYLAAAALQTGAAAALLTLHHRRPHCAFARSQARCLRELADALDRLAATAGGIALVSTKEGLRLSGSPTGTHLTISAPGLGARGAGVIAGQIALLRRCPLPEVRPGRTGSIFHLIFPAS